MAKKYKHMKYVNIDDENQNELEEGWDGSFTDFYRDIRAFWHRNYDRWEEEQESKRKLQQSLRRGK